MRLVCTILGAVIFVWANVSSAHACTVFSFTGKGDRFVAKNYESETPGNLVIKQHPSHISYTSGKLTWHVKHDSITVSSNESIVGGVNSAGLMLEILECPPYRFSRGAQSVDWIKYHLDQFSNVQSVIHSLESLSEKLDAQDSARFMGCDPTECFFAEIKAGKVQYSRRDDFTPEVMADLLNDQKPASALAARAPATDMNVDQIMEKLEKVENSKTQWSIAYDLGRRGFTIKTKSMGVARTFSLVSMPKALSVQQLYPIK